MPLTVWRLTPVARKQSAQGEYYCASPTRIAKAEHSTPRNGAATLWIIAVLPLCLLLLVIVVEIGTLWNTRSELLTALDAAALAGVKTWGDSIEAGVSPNDATAAARQAAVASFASNTVHGLSWTLDPNESMGGTPHGNLSCAGEVILAGAQSGSLAASTSLTPSCGAGSDVDYCVITRKTLSVPSVCRQMFGFSVGPFQVSGQAVARAGCTGSTFLVANPKVSHLSSIACTE